MLLGRVTGDGAPVLSLPVGDRVWIALVDTGFSGYLELPLALAEQVHPRYRGRSLTALAAGQAAWEDQYWVDFPFGGAVHHVIATFIEGDEILIGTSLRADYRLEINFVRSTVLVERAQ